MYFLLSYEYGPNAFERRAPFREAHLKLASEAQARGELIVGGAFDPVDGAALVFKGETEAVAEAFVRQDPYVSSGLVTGWRIRKWTVVLGGTLAPV